jgi:DivIVA domain-containing protein
MQLTPEQVRDQKFTVVRLREGYQQDEVDNFLDLVYDDYIELLRACSEADERYRSVTRRVQSGEETMVLPAVPPLPTPSIESITGLLVAAEGQARKIVEEAGLEKSEIINDARNTASATMDDADRRAALVVSQAEEKAAQIVSEAQTDRLAALGALEEKRANLQAQLDSMETAHATAKAALEGALGTLS